ncbi:MAG: hypothetical protein NTX64_18115 [Elusimicrobia bacterium]|nr:hypothetical protein [Elusimicrobiota bacterium]
MNRILAAALIFAIPAAASASRTTSGAATAGALQTGSPGVAAIVVAWTGAAAIDKDETNARMFAHGDTVADRVRQAFGGKRAIAGRTFGPVTIEAPAQCDLGALFASAVKASGADLTGYSAAVIVGPDTSCDFSKTATGEHGIVVAGAFGTGWVASAATALQAAMTPPAAPIQGSAIASSITPTHRKIARKPKSELLTLASVDRFLDAPEAAGEMAEMRDAPAPVARPMPIPAAAIGWRAGASARTEEAITPPSDDSNRSSYVSVLEIAGRSGERPGYRLDADACFSGARNLRQAAKASSGLLSDDRAEAAAARRGLAAAVRRELGSMRAHDLPEDADVSLLTTSAETELDAALMRLEDFRRSPGGLRASVAASVTQAAKDLELAGRRLSRQP